MILHSNQWIHKISKRHETYRKEPLKDGSASGTFQQRYRELRLKTTEVLLNQTRGIMIQACETTIENNAMENSVTSETIRICNNYVIGVYTRGLLRDQARWMLTILKDLGYCLKFQTLYPDINGLLFRLLGFCGDSSGRVFLTF